MTRRLTSHGCTINNTKFAIAPLAAAVGTAIALSGCGGDSSSSKKVGDAVYDILMSGGSNTSGAVTTGGGGDGGDLDMYKYGALSEIGIFNSGRADASFSAVSTTAFLGANPLMVTADTTVDTLDAEPALGTPYFDGTSAGDNMYISDGDGTLGSADADEVPVTGISVAAGVTLTLDLNSNIDPALATESQLDLENDLDNNGTITTLDQPGGDRGDLDIEPGSYLSSSTGSIDTSGTTDGQSGGSVDIDADGIVLNNGTVSTAGADNAAGAAGSAGSITLEADYMVQNTADLDSTGGDSADDAGGSGGDITLDSNDGPIWNSGNLVSAGGSGDTSGGSGGDIDLDVNSLGGVLNSGNLTSSGGSGNTAGGGSGGDIDLYSRGDDFMSSGDLVARGGTGAWGGSGGDVDLYADYGSTIDADEYHSAGQMDVSGHIDTRGGDATDPDEDAGDGGDFDIENYPYYYGTNNRLRLLGYRTVDTSGGDGEDAGSGGDVDLYADYGWNYSPYYAYIPGGNVINEVPIDATGGNSLLTAGTDGEGGDGGNVNLESTYDYGQDFIDPNTGELTARTMNSATIDNSGGANFNANSNSDGSSGYIWMWGYNGVTNTADLTSNGGSDAAADGGIDGYGGYANDVQMYAEEEPVDNSGNVASSGGNGEYDGGYADSIELFAVTVDNSGDLTGNGGDADPLLADSNGGDGSDVELYAVNGLAGISNSGAISNSGGAGETAGDDGDTVIGGQCISGPDC